MGVLVLVVPPMSPPPSLARLAVGEELKIEGYDEVQVLPEV